MKVGIEAINVYGGKAFLDVKKLAQVRGLDSERFDNLLMKRKSISLYYEDPVSFGANAAIPIIRSLNDEEKNKIELLIVSSESGIDFGKAMSTYIHHYLGLNRNCRTFETKHACYAGTASLQMAASFILSKVSPGSKALVISTDVARTLPNTYTEPSQGAAAVALLVSDQPTILELEQGANGYYGYEVMDTCRPTPETEVGDADLSLLSYLDCIENSFKHYKQRVGEINFQDYFDYLAFHTPFGAMAKGAHRTMMRNLIKIPPKLIQEDFVKRLEPSFRYCQMIGNAYSGSLFLALCGIIDAGDFNNGKRIGLFSYGSGCCSEFYSGIATKQSQKKLAQMEIAKSLDCRYELNIEEYEELLVLNKELMFGVQDKENNFERFKYIYQDYFYGNNLLVLKRISNYHREYEWV